MLDLYRLMKELLELSQLNEGGSVNLVMYGKTIVQAGDAGVFLNGTGWSVQVHTDKGLVLFYEGTTQENLAAARAYLEERRRVHAGPSA